MRTAQLFGLRALVVSLPPGEDPSDLLRSEHGVQRFERCVQDATDPVTFFLMKIRLEDRLRLAERLEPLLDFLATLTPLAATFAVTGPVASILQVGKPEVAGLLEAVRTRREAPTLTCPGCGAIVRRNR
jgi:hypothetical protein